MKEKKKRRGEKEDCAIEAVQLPPCFSDLAPSNAARTEQQG